MTVPLRSSRQGTLYCTAPAAPLSFLFVIASQIAVVCVRHTMPMAPIVIAQTDAGVCADAAQRARLRTLRMAALTLSLARAAFDAPKYPKEKLLASAALIGCTYAVIASDGDCMYNAFRVSHHWPSGVAPSVSELQTVAAARLPEVVGDSLADLPTTVRVGPNGTVQPVVRTVAAYAAALVMPTAWGCELALRALCLEYNVVTDVYLAMDDGQLVLHSVINGYTGKQHVAIISHGAHWSGLPAAVPMSGDSLPRAAAAAAASASGAAAAAAASADAQPAAAAPASLDKVQRKRARAAAAKAADEADDATISAFMKTDAAAAPSVAAVSGAAAASVPLHTAMRTAAAAASATARRELKRAARTAASASADPADSPAPAAGAAAVGSTAKPSAATKAGVAPGGGGAAAARPAGGGFSIVKCCRTCDNGVALELSAEVLAARDARVRSGKLDVRCHVFCDAHFEEAVAAAVCLSDAAQNRRLGDAARAFIAKASDADVSAFVAFARVGSPLARGHAQLDLLKAAHADLTTRSKTLPAAADSPAATAAFDAACVQHDASVAKVRDGLSAGHFAAGVSVASTSTDKRQATVVRRVVAAVRSADLLAALPALASATSSAAAAPVVAPEVGAGAQPSSRHVARSAESVAQAYAVMARGRSAHDSALVIARLRERLRVAPLTAPLVPPAAAAARGGAAPPAAASGAAAASAATAAASAAAFASPSLPALASSASPPETDEMVVDALDATPQAEQVAKEETASADADEDLALGVQAMDNFLDGKSDLNFDHDATGLREQTRAAAAAASAAKEAATAAAALRVARIQRALDVGVIVSSVYDDKPGHPSSVKAVDRVQGWPAFVDSNTSPAVFDERGSRVIRPGDVITVGMTDWRIVYIREIVVFKEGDNLKVRFNVLSPHSPGYVDLYDEPLDMQAQYATYADGVTFALPRYVVLAGSCYVGRTDRGQDIVYVAGECPTAKAYMERCSAARAEFYAARGRLKALSLNFCGAGTGAHMFVSTLLAASLDKDMTHTDRVGAAFVAERYFLERMQPRLPTADARVAFLIEAGVPSPSEFYSRGMTDGICDAARDARAPPGLAIEGAAYSTIQELVPLAVNAGVFEDVDVGALPPVLL